MHYIVLFILAALTHRCVSWAGGNLHEIDSMDSQYAVFTFTDDRHESMTTNILMNIFVPNVVMLFIALGTKAIGWNDAYHYVWLFVCFYYCYRAFLRILTGAH